MKGDTIAPINCLWCGKEIPEGRRGHGHPPKTCSEECRKARASDRERTRYTKIKDTPEWQETRQNYIAKLKTRAAMDFDFAQYLRERQRVIRDRYRAKLEQDPVRLEAFRKKQREWFHNMTPQQRTEKLARDRAWYRSLSREDRQMRYYQMRLRRAQEQLDTLEKEAKMLTNAMRPVSPGEVLREDFMRPLNMTGADMARRLGVPATRISDILHARRGVTADTAMRLARVFGGDAQSWLNMQSAYDLRKAQRDMRVRRAVEAIEPRDQRDDL